MSIEDRLKTLRLAEVDAEASRVRAHDAVARLREGAKTAATPWRIVIVGGVFGFMAGRSKGSAGPGIGGRLFATAAQALITTLGASATAGAAAGSAADAAAEAAADATVKATTQAVHAEGISGDV